MGERLRVRTRPSGNRPIGRKDHGSPELRRRSMAHSGDNDLGTVSCKEAAAWLMALAERNEPASEAAVFAAVSPTASKCGRPCFASRAIPTALGELGSPPSSGSVRQRAGRHAGTRLDRAGSSRRSGGAGVRDLRPVAAAEGGGCARPRSLRRARARTPSSGRRHSSGWARARIPPRWRCLRNCLRSSARTRPPDQN